MRQRSWQPLLAILVVVLGPSLLPADDLGLKVPPGFRVTLYADHELANDIYAMTLDSKGRVVVTSQGWIKVLHDTKGTGKADQATVFAKTPTGGMGLCFDGDDLYFCGDGWLSRYRDPAGMGEAEGPPERLFPMHFGEHGGHAMRKGPDGFWYFIGGNDTGIDQRHVTTRNSLVQKPEGGGLLRISPDGKQCEVVAQGFRNPYDFDFNPAGDLFTYDSDVEADYFLPWYSPTRLYHIAPGGHHGWRLTGYKRSWCRQDYYLDTVDILWPVGRGSPTGVTCYRHDQFPEHYRGGIFALDWTFGKVYFFPLESDGSSYTTKPELFLEAVGTNGFDPTDVVVAPDGSLFICMGGRKTRGAVFRVEYVGDEKNPVKRLPAPQTDLDAVLNARQPLDAWSRAKWVPLARKLGAKPFAEAVADEKRDAAGRVRAVEVLTELFDGLTIVTAKAGSQASFPSVRARVAWSLGRVPQKKSWPILAELAKDGDQRVRLYALDALNELFPDLDSAALPAAVVANLDQPDKRVRQSAARLAAKLPDSAWKQVGSASSKATPSARLTFALVAHWRNSNDESRRLGLTTALAILDRSKNAHLRRDALRLVMLVFGDYHLQDPPAEVYTAYSLQGSLKGYEEECASIAKAVRAFFPSGDAKVDAEAGRLLAMLEDNNKELPHKVAAFWTEKSSPTDDMHYLTVFSRLPGPRDADDTAKTVHTLLGLDRKLRGQQQRNKQNWGVRLSEAFVNLLKYDSRLADAVLNDPAFVQPAHVPLAAAFDDAHRKKAARLFLETVKKNGDFAWSAGLMDLLMLLPAEEVRPVLREQWSDYGLRDAILLQLADKPDALDCDKFLTGLESAQMQVVRASLSALEKLTRDGEAKSLVPLFRLLRSLLSEPKEKDLRGRVLTLIQRQSGEPFAIKEESTDPAALKKAYQPAFDWFDKKHPTQAKLLQGDNGEDAAAWEKTLRSVDWEKGVTERGAALFRTRASMTCHTGATRLGPDLAGVTTRMSRDDVFTAIIYPSRDVAPAYRVVTIETPKGQSYSGIVAFESADGVILQTGAATTVRIATPDIASRKPSNRSLMPDGLLKDLKPADLADLYRYLQTIKPDKSSK